MIFIYRSQHEGAGTCKNVQEVIERATSSLNLGAVDM
jgi:hypothetical protein